MSNVTIYHGSRYEVRRPDTKHSRGNEDFGAGFYCTKYMNFAGAWACRELTEQMWKYYDELGIGGVDGYVINKYELDTDGLNVIDLDKLNTIQFVSLLVNSKKYMIPKSMHDKTEIKWLKSQNIVDIKQADILISSRWVDVWSCIFLNDFLYSKITLQELEESFKIVDAQAIVLKSKAACDRIAETASSKDIGPYIESYNNLYAGSVFNPYNRIYDNLKQLGYNDGRGEFLIDIAQRAQ